ncbi:hypothetical protein DICPUDRAFT_155772 [Dictyostelium purpureum]|uniref:Uncharacterized protein n=1 Tax=Dictyostelium purpureum TaxID=5786 RepID=F0ZUU6_DICPU|nr:uncharacterized protein DICPUDRAFT_155772 [Dictyostelium purpureum]EGC32278.1 hypothetical protein DICPUDRAFT_155772 [Dictyostelium purpureum]|eukprot:XP_003291187.1 hypothetical protein DICPUDRAFT_155772 [Dictyostelium purpureum]
MKLNIYGFLYLTFLFLILLNSLICGYVLKDISISNFYKQYASDSADSTYQCKFTAVVWCEVSDQSEDCDAIPVDSSGGSISNSPSFKNGTTKVYNILLETNPGTFSVIFGTTIVATFECLGGF